MSKAFNQDLQDSQGDVVQIGYGASANHKKEYEALGENCNFSKRASQVSNGLRTPRKFGNERQRNVSKASDDEYKR